MIKTATIIMVEQSFERRRLIDDKYANLDRELAVNLSESKRV